MIWSKFTENSGFLNFNEIWLIFRPIPLYETNAIQLHLLVRLFWYPSQWSGSICSIFCTRLYTTGIHCVTGCLILKWKKLNGSIIIPNFQDFLYSIKILMKTHIFSLKNVSLFLILENFCWFQKQLVPKRQIWVPWVLMFHQKQK